MSLINDALKKAQKRQSPSSAEAESVPGPAMPTAAPGVPRRRQSPPFERMLVGVVALVVVLVGATVIGVLVWKKEGKPVMAAASRAATPAPAVRPAPAPPASAPPAAALPAPALPAPAPVAPPVAASAPSTAPAATAAPLPEPPAAAATVSSPAAPPPRIVSPPPASEPPATSVLVASRAPPSGLLPVVVAIAPAPPPPATAPPPAPQPSSVQVNLSAAATPAPAAPPPARVARTEPAAAPPAAAAEVSFRRRVLDYIDNLHVTGMRAAGSDSKVLMNDRIYRVNDVVDRELGLRLTGVSTTVLVFTDENGKVYTKPLQ